MNAAEVLKQRLQEAEKREFLSAVGPALGGLPASMRSQVVRELQAASTKQVESLSLEAMEEFVQLTLKHLE